MSWDAIQVVAFQIGLKPAEFYDITPKEFVLLQRAHEKNEQTKQQAIWDSTRWLACILLQPHMRKGRNIKPKDLAKFPWDEKTKKTKAYDNKQIKKQAAYTAKLYEKIWSDHGKEKD